MFRNDAAEFVYIRTYSRWVEEENRREKWDETVNRYVNFLVQERGEYIPTKVINKIRESMLKFNVMPSMRALWSAGEAAKSDNVCFYNCSFLAADSVESFAECLYILMCGTGVGFSVELEETSKLPIVSQMSGISGGTYVIPDSKRGWADSVKKLMYALYDGRDLDMDYSLLRPKGARLKTMGGRSSGPAPLLTLHNFIRSVFQKAQGRKLTPLECHDIMNQIAEIVVVGGVRRSSQISLSDIDDREMAAAKVHPFPVRRYMANNSAVYYTKPDAVRFLKEWSELAASGTGERGIFNLEAARSCSPQRRDVSQIRGVNPCSEILLRKMEFCNLSEVVVRAEDDLDDLLEKVETATWIGIIQSTFTHFPYLRKKWIENCEEERLLGVSITGQMDNCEALTDDAFKALRARAIKTAKRAAKIMGINVPAAITCVKPSGTVSQLVDSASGIHARYSQYYIRRYRISSIDPLFKMMNDQGIPFSAENGQRKKDWNKAEKIYEETKDLAKAKEVCSIFDIDNGGWSSDKVNTWVVSFPIEAPKGAVVVNDMTALQQLEYYKRVQKHWCEHNASNTIYVKDHEWFEVGNWVYKNWDVVNGVAFLPHDGGHYEQTPYEEIDKKTYQELVAKMPKIDYSKLGDYEKEDGTESSKAWACTGDKCELV